MASLASEPGQHLDHENLSHRTNVITLQVSNDWGLDTAYVSIKVTNVLDTPLIANISGNSNIKENSVFILHSSSSADAATPIESYLWEQVNQTASTPPVIINTPTADSTELTIPYLTDINLAQTLTFRLTVRTGSESQISEHNVVVSSSSNRDSDGDGLIDLRDLVMLHNMRHNLKGTSYQTNSGGTAMTSGCPNDVYRGYELLYDLDFDTDGDGTWSTNSSGDYLLDMDDHHDLYFDVAAGLLSPPPPNFFFRAYLSLRESKKS